MSEPFTPDQLAELATIVDRIAAAWRRFIDEVLLPAYRKLVAAFEGAVAAMAVAHGASAARPAWQSPYGPSRPRRPR